MSPTRTWLAGVFAVLLVAGCDGEQAAPTRTPDTSEAAPPDTAASDTSAAPRPGEALEDTTAAPAPSSDWTSAVTDWTPPADPRMTTLQAVRTGGHESFDRAVFAFAGDTLPGYHVEYVDEPVRQCGSGNTVPLAGEGWLEVRFTPARAHTDAGEPTVEERERAPGLPLLKELKLTCDFEGRVTWVLGLSAPNRYRVLRLENPARVVVDVRR